MTPTHEVNNTATASPLVNSTMVVLAIYNVIYWASPVVGVFQPIIVATQKIWGLMSFLEFLAVAALIIDLTVRWDQFENKQRRMRFIFTFILAASFFVRFVFGILSLYIVGEAH